MVNHPLTDGPTEPLVYCVVLNWNGYEDTSTCLRSLTKLDYNNLETVVVDNGSEDGSGRQLDDEFPNVTVLYNNENRGFAGGMNRGIRHAQEAGAAYAWILNNDTIVPSDSNIIQRLIDPMELNDEIGVTSPLISNTNGERVWFQRGEIDKTTLRATHPNREEPISDIETKQGLIENDYVPLCCSMVDMCVFTEVGLLDEEFFLYYEDVQFAIDVKQAGFRLLTVPSVSVRHEVSTSAGNNLDPIGSYYDIRNWLLLFRKQKKADSTSRFVLSYIYWIALMTVNRIIHCKWRGLYALLRGIIDGVQNQNGRGPYP